jgi:5-methylcytosine-specific restriction protein A
MSKAWAGGSTKAWRNVRAAVLIRDRHQCQLQLPGVCIGVATHAHHTQPRAVVGDNPVHLLAACAPCNTSYGDPAQPKYGDPRPRPRTTW